MLIARPVVRFQSAIGYRMLSAKGCTDWLDAVPKDAFRPEWHDLAYLYKIVRERKPKVVVEFGSGCSTPVIAAALPEGGKLFSLDASQEWLDVTRKYFPEHLTNRVEFIFAPAYESRHEGRAVWRSHNVPDVVADMVYLDGPPLTKERPIAVDVLDMKLSPNAFIVVDGRKENFAYLKAKMAGFAFEWHRIGYRGVITQ